MRSLSPTCDQRPLCQPHNGTECHGQSLKHLQGQCLHHLLGHSIPVFHHPFSDEIPPKVQPKITMPPYTNAVLGRRGCTPPKSNHPIQCSVSSCCQAALSPCFVLCDPATGWLQPQVLPLVWVFSLAPLTRPQLLVPACPLPCAETLSPCHAVLCNYLRKLECVIFNQHSPPPQDSTEP